MYAAMSILPAFACYSVVISCSLLYLCATMRIALPATFLFFLALLLVWRGCKPPATTYACVSATFYIACSCLQRLFAFCLCRAAYLPLFAYHLRSASPLPDEFSLQHISRCHFRARSTALGFLSAANAGSCAARDGVRLTSSPALCDSTEQTNMATLFLRHMLFIISYGNCHLLLCRWEETGM